MTQPNAATPAAATGHEPIGLATTAWALLLSALWSGTPVAVKYSSATLEPMAVAGIRFGLAALCVLAWCRWFRAPLALRRGQLLPALVVGVLLFVQIGTFTLGVFRSTASHGTLFINTYVIWVAAAEHFVTRTDRLTWLRSLGLLLALGGVLLTLALAGAASPGALPAAAALDRPSLFGDLLLLSSGVVLALMVLVTKRAVQVLEPLKLVFWHDVIAAALFFAASLATETTSAADFTPPVVAGLAYQGIVVGGFCFAVQAELLRRHSASRLSVFSFASPLFGVALAVLLRGDQLSPWLGLSAVCVAAGIFLVTTRHRP